MATCIWEGQAAAIAQVDTITIALTWATGDTATLTINGTTLVLTVGTDTTTAQVATAIKEMFNGDTQTGTGDHTFSRTGDQVPEFSEITASVSGSVVSLTADTAGTPFTITAAETTAGDGTATRAAGTANASPNDWNDNDNWSGSVPVGADDVIIENSAVDILWSLDQNAVTLTSLTIKASFTGKIGLPRSNDAGYVEYLDTYLKIGATTVTIGDGHDEGRAVDGSGRIKLDTHTVQTELNMNYSAVPAENGVPAVLWKGTHTDNVININRGTFGAAFFGGETANFQTLRVGYVRSVNTDTEVQIGAGVTHKAGGTITQTGGLLHMRSATITATVQAGAFILDEDATITTLNLYGGSCAYRSDGTATTINVYGGATLDCREDLRARTITNCTVYSGATIYDPQQTVTFTNGVDVSACGLEDVTLHLGKHLTWTPSAI